jgi:peptidoglycan hydrolase-like protein with peptidoglycan-binding domain
MTVRIGHASIAENGKASGGTSGDQTGKEVLIRDWYNKPWNVLLRPVRPELAEESAVACEEACANPNIGYDQGGRNTLYAKAKAVQFDISAITDPCECDCSSLMHVCAIAGGANMTYGSNGHTTRTMVREFVNSGDYVKLTGSEYLSSSRLLKRGDILVKEGSHTVMVLEGAHVLEKPAEKEEPVTAFPLPLLQSGAANDAVKSMQLLLFARGYYCPQYGIFEKRTEAALREFQTAFNLKSDGICGRDTWLALLGITGAG